MRLPKLGTRVRVVWMDATAVIGSPLTEAKCVLCWTEGKLVKADKEFLVIASSQYIEDGPERERVGDYTSLPLGMIQSIKRL